VRLWISFSNSEIKLCIFYIIILFLSHMEQFYFIIKKSDESCMDIVAIDCSGAAPIDTLCGQKVKFVLIRLAVFKLNIKSRF